jgi:hypothetical protein
MSLMLSVRTVLIGLGWFADFLLEQKGERRAKDRLVD